MSLYLVVFVWLVGVPHCLNVMAELVFPAIVVVHLHRRDPLSYYGFASLRALDYRSLLYLVPTVTLLVVTASLGPSDDGRSRIDDWDADTVAGRQGGACLVTQVDRRRGYLVGGKATRKAHEEVNETTTWALAYEVVRTMTLDRGKEFSDAYSLLEAIGAPYFCLPHHP